MRRREEDGVGVRHAVVVEDDAVRPRRLGAGGDDDIVAADRGVFGLVVALGARRLDWNVRAGFHRPGD